LTGKRDIHINKMENKIFVTNSLKRESKKSLANYRGVTELATTGRRYGCIIKKRIEQQISIGEDQSDFTAGRSIKDKIFTIKQLIEKRKANNVETHLVFIDLEKAYDTVPLQRLFEILEKSSVKNVTQTPLKKCIKIKVVL
jgi:hypothetical protein